MSSPDVHVGDGKFPSYVQVIEIFTFLMCIGKGGFQLLLCMQKKEFPAYGVWKGNLALDVYM
jgi:predicted metal-binding protein